MYRLERRGHGLAGSRVEEVDPRLRAFLEASYDAFYDWHVGADVSEVSDRWFDLLGYPAGEARHSAPSWADLLHPDDLVRTDEETRQAFSSRTRRLSQEYRVRRYDGSYILLHDQTIISYDADGRPERMIGALRDVTHEREVERRLEETAFVHRTLTERTATLILQVAPSGEYLDANPAALELLGLSRDQLLALRFEHHFPAELLAETEGAPAADAVRSREIVLDLDGVPKTVVVETITCVLEGRRVIFCLATDITARVLLEARLADTNTALRVLLEQFEHERAEDERQIMANVNALILPTLDRLATQLRGRPEAAYADAIRENLTEILRPVARNLSRRRGDTPGLTPRELEVANLVKLGKSSEQIAEALCLSRATVQFHRANIRRKLGLTARDQNLRTALLADVETGDGS